MPRVSAKNRAASTAIKKGIRDVNVALKLESKDEFGKPLNIQCKCCNKIKEVKRFLVCNSPSSTTGYTPICKDCLSMLSLDGNGNFNKEKVYEVCKLIDKPFINKIFEKVDTMMNSTKTSSVAEKNKIGVYINMVNSTVNGYRSSGFLNSESIIDSNIENAKENIEENNNFWGNGWNDDEKKQLNELFEEYQNNYPLRTAMHKMALIKICKLQVRYDTAIASNNTNDAKYWGDLLSKAQNEAKFNPSQLSAADLSDGMTCFSQLSSVVEKAQDIIPLLPQFLEEPKDRIDYTLWEYINYARHLNGKPLCTYKEIYGFLNKRYESLKKRYKFLKEEKDGSFDTNDVDTE